MEFSLNWRHYKNRTINTPKNIIHHILIKRIQQIPDAYTLVGAWSLVKSCCHPDVYFIFFFTVVTLWWIKIPEVKFCEECRGYPLKATTLKRFGLAKGILYWWHPPVLKCELACKKFTFRGSYKVICRLWC